MSQILECLQGQQSYHITFQFYEGLNSSTMCQETYISQILYERNGLSLYVV